MKFKDLMLKKIFLKFLGFEISDRVFRKKFLKIFWVSKFGLVVWFVYLCKKYYI